MPMRPYASGSVSTKWSEALVASKQRTRCRRTIRTSARVALLPRLDTCLVSVRLPARLSLSARLRGLPWSAIKLRCQGHRTSDWINSFRSRYRVPLPVTSICAFGNFHRCNAVATITTDAIKKKKKKGKMHCVFLALSVSYSLCGCQHRAAGT